MTSCMIIDDDELSRLTLEKLLDQAQLLELRGSCSNPLEAVPLLEQHPVDVLFLDVEMPEMSGLDFLRSLKKAPVVILVTARPEYAADAFDLDVADYLVKPPTLPRFLKAVHRALDAVAENRAAASPAVETASTLFVKVGTQLKGIPVDEIAWIEGTGDYATIQAGRDKYVTHATLKRIEARLPKDRFMRVHRSHIVQLSKITAIEGGLIIIGTQLIPLAERFQSQLMMRLNKV